MIKSFPMVIEELVLVFENRPRDLEALLAWLMNKGLVIEPPITPVIEREELVEPTKTPLVALVGKVIGPSKVKELPFKSMLPPLNTNVFTIKSFARPIVEPVRP